MVDIKEEDRNLKNKGNNLLNLETILNQKVTLNTDIMDFLLIAGWNAGGSCYRNATEELCQRLRGYINKKREMLSSGEKHKESRFRNSILEGGYGKRFKTIGELKSIVENEGIKIRNLHYKTFAYFNDTLKEYGVKPIKVGGRHTPAILRNLKKYGIEPGKKENLYTNK